MVVLCFSNSLRNASIATAVGAKLQCALCAEKANRNRGSTKKGVPHLIASWAWGATLLSIAYSRRKCGWPLCGAAAMYSAIVVGRLLAISIASNTDPCRRALELPRYDGLAAQDNLGALQPRVAASTSAACASGIPRPSYVLPVLGLSAEQANSSMRLSFVQITTDPEVERAADRRQRRGLGLARRGPGKIHP